MSKLEKNHNYFYKITNNVNSNYYYGIHSTNNLEDGYLGGGDGIKRAIKKHGRENFTKEIIADYPTRKEASDHEARVVTLELIKLKECYNRRAGGDNENYISEETKKKLSLKHTGKILSYEHVQSIVISKSGDRNPNFGKPKSEETKKKMRQSNVGQKRSEETKRKMSEAKLGENHPNFSKKLKEETKAKIRHNNPLCKSCKVLGISYKSVSDAARQLNLSRDVVKGRIKSKATEYNYWEYI